MPSREFAECKFITKEVQKLFDIFNNIQPDGLFQRSRMRGIRISQENTIGIGRLQPLVYFGHSMLDLGSGRICGISQRNYSMNKFQTLLMPHRPICAHTKEKLVHLSCRGENFTTK
jgi:hypothetical protein